MFGRNITQTLLVLLIIPAIITCPGYGHVILDAPNGAETLSAGNTYSVTWHVQISHTMENWDLWYSTTGDTGPWIDLIMDLPAEDTSVDSIHTFDWTIPAVYSDFSRVRVRMDVSPSSTQGPWYDISDMNFTIIPEPTTSVLLAFGVIAVLMGRQKK